MKVEEAAIKSGIGFHTAEPSAALTAGPAKDFLASHCANQELFQDIWNLVQKHAEVVRKDVKRFVMRSVDPLLFLQHRVFDAHKVVQVRVGMLYPNFHGAWINIRMGQDIYVSITEDGIITDIVECPAKMNPSNGRHVYPTKW